MLLIYSSPLHHDLSFLFVQFHFIVLKYFFIFFTHLIWVHTLYPFVNNFYTGVITAICHSFEYSSSLQILLNISGNFPILFCGHHFYNICNFIVSKCFPFSALFFVFLIPSFYFFASKFLFWNIFCIFLSWILCFISSDHHATCFLLLPDLYVPQNNFAAFNMLFLRDIHICSRFSCSIFICEYVNFYFRVTFMFKLSQI